MTEAVTPSPEAVAPVTPDPNTATPVVETPAVAAEPNVIANPATGEVKPWIADDWRQRMAGNDEKALERLKRFPDVGAIFKSYRELETKLSSGQVKTSLPENASEEQVAAYRKENGIPETASDYEFALADGVVIGEDDTPAVSKMLDVMHKANTPTGVVQAVINGYFQMRNEQVAQASEAQRTTKLETEELLRSDWGGNYLSNIATVRNFLAGAPEGFADQIMTARLPNGNTLGNDYNAIKWLSQVALELNPASTVVPTTAGNQMETIDSKINEYQALMSKNIDAWHKNTAAKADYQKLLAAKEKLTVRGR